MLDIHLEKFFQAKKVLAKTVVTTPLVPAPFQSLYNNPILLKAECLQLSGSFKIRGATYAISQLSDAQKAKGVIAYSTGNHAQAVALAAKMHHIKAVIVLSPDVAPHKLANVQAFGAEVVMTRGLIIKKKRSGRIARPKEKV